MVLSVLLLDAHTPERGSDVAPALRAAGHPVQEAQSEQEACAFALAGAPSVVVIGGRMPGTEALRLLRRLRARGWRQPIVVRGDASSTEDCIAALTAGADDFVGRDRDPRELVARLHAVLRRTRAAEAGPRLCFGRVEIDLTRMEATSDGEPLALTQTEFSLLAILARAQGKPVLRAAMLEEIWGFADGARTRTIETHIWRLRKKIGDDGAEPRWILNHPGVGYSLAPGPAP